LNDSGRWWGLVVMVTPQRRWVVGMVVVG